MIKNLFSSQAHYYARYRPTYPAELYDFVLGHVRGRELAWDCATGNGQVARELAKHFQRVIATDISEKQLSEVTPKENIDYQKGKAEHCQQADYSFDLITVGQALHWFDLNAFYREVKRVAKPEGILAVWGYGLMRISSEIDDLILHFYRNVVGPYWEFNRSYVESAYATLPFPFREVPCPEFGMEKRWTLAELEGYLNSWSSVVTFTRQQGFNPVSSFVEHLRPHWPGGEALSVTFPIFMRLGYVD